MYTICTYTFIVKFEWDPEKAASNLKKHDVDFADAVPVFEDPRAITIADTDHDEERYVTMGMDGFGRVLVIVYTYRGENLRLISARKAEKKECKQYGE